MTKVPSSKPMVVRDPVHGYIEIAAWERAIIDHPITQRLRRISQTGLSDMVFPEARTSRFSHSLGSMHLASRFFMACIEHSQEETISKFVHQIEPLFSRYGDTESEENLCRGAGLGTRSPRMILPGKLGTDPSTRKAVSFSEAALRLAALFHDLGHLPLSHDFENALRAYSANPSIEGDLNSKLKEVSSEDAPHEVLGHRLADLVFREIGVRSGCPADVLDLAFKILHENSSYFDMEGRHITALGWLHSIIDGELDVDRCDYLLRDGRALGLDFASFDLDRLLYSVVLKEDAEAGFITALTEQGLGPFESFVLTRNRSHKAFVRHHKVAQLAAALRVACVNALDDPECLPLKADIVNLADSCSTPDQEVLERFRDYDDGWWLEVLRRRERSQNLTSRLTPLEAACFSAVLRRDSKLKSVWKRAGDLSDSERVDLNKFFEIGSSSVPIKEVEDELSKDQIIFTRFHFRPFKKRKVGDRAGESIVPISVHGDLLPASVLSPVFKAVDEIWNLDVQGYAYSTEAIPPSAVIAKINSALSRLKEKQG